MVKGPTSEGPGLPQMRGCSKGPLGQTQGWGVARASALVNVAQNTPRPGPTGRPPQDWAGRRGLPGISTGRS